MNCCSMMFITGSEFLFHEILSVFFADYDVTNFSFIIFAVSSVNWWVFSDFILCPFLLDEAIYVAITLAATSSKDEAVTERDEQRCHCSG